MKCIGSAGVFLLGLLYGASVQAFCWETVASRYDIEPELLQAIAGVESDYRPTALNHNSNGSRDIGLMQINSSHLPQLLSRGITEKRLLEEPCLSIEVGASILAQLISRYGYNWMAIGSYNAGPGKNRGSARLRYAQRVWARYEALMAERPEDSDIEVIN